MTAEERREQFIRREKLRYCQLVAELRAAKDRFEELLAESDRVLERIVRLKGSGNAKDDHV